MDDARLEELIWELAPRRKGIPYSAVATALRIHGHDVVPGEVYAVIHQMVVAGHLYWRDPRHPYRVIRGNPLVGPRAEVSFQDDQLPW